jgi:hypothetical protein
VKLDEKSRSFFQGEFLKLVHDVNRRSIQEFQSSRRQTRSHNLNNRIGGFTNEIELHHGSHELCREADQAKGDLCDDTQCPF